MNIINIVLAIFLTVSIYMTHFKHNECNTLTSPFGVIESEMNVDLMPNVLRP